MLDPNLNCLIQIKDADDSQFTDFDGVERCPKLRAKTPGPSANGSVRLERSALRREERAKLEEEVKKTKTLITEVMIIIAVKPVNKDLSKWSS